MKHTTLRSLLSALLLTSAFVAHADDVKEARTVEQLASIAAAQRHPFTMDMALAPDGKHFALAIQKDEQQSLKIVNIATGETTKQVEFDDDWRFGQLFWANSERILVQPRIQTSFTNRPFPTGAIYGVNVDGSKERFILGANAGARTGALSGRSNKRILGLIVNTLKDDKRKVLVQVFDPASKRPSIAKLDVYTGRLSNRSYGPAVQFCDFGLDDDLQATFCMTTDREDDRSQVYYRASGKEDWAKIHESVWDDRYGMRMHGKLEDGSYLATFPHPETSVTAYYSLSVEDGVLKRSLMHVDPTFDPVSVSSGPRGRNVLWATYANPKPSYVYFGQDENVESLHKSITAAFPDHYVAFRGITEDNKLALVRVGSDVSPVRLFLMDVENKKMQLVDNAYEAVETMASPMDPMKLKARDGMDLHGFVSLANNQPAKGTVMYLHGGPHGPYDRWGADPDTYFFTSLGFNVVQVNFRGSGGFGLAHQRAGYNEWGRKMQDDVTDATKWAIENGYAEEGKICIYGGSYGAYTSLAGAAFEPGLYSCAVGHVGVYDLNVMRTDGDIPDRKSGIRFLDRVIGKDKENLASRSPSEFASNIKIPVLLTAGLDDDRTPPIQTRIMAKALKEAGNPATVSYQAKEGHGFFSEEAETKRLVQLGNFMLDALGAGE